MPSLKLLDSMGVDRARVIPTTPSVRWEMNAQGQSMDWTEYLAAAVEIAKVYAVGDHSMELNFWRTASLYPSSHAFSFDAVRYSASSFKPSRPCCRQTNGMVSVAADGEIYPCLQCSGWYSAHDVSFGNAFEVGLAGALKGSHYCAFVHASVADKVEHQRERLGNVAYLLRITVVNAGGRSCTDCRWLTWCAGGCPALSALTHNGDMLMPDPCSCEFFDGDWSQRFADALSRWHCLSELPSALKQPLL